MKYNESVFPLPLASLRAFLNFRLWICSMSWLYLSGCERWRLSRSGSRLRVFLNFRLWICSMSWLYLSGFERWRRRLWCCSVSRLRGQTRWSLKPGVRLHCKALLYYWMWVLFSGGKPIQSFAILMTFCFWLWLKNTCLGLKFVFEVEM